MSADQRRRWRRRAAVLLVGMFSLIVAYVLVLQDRLGAGATWAVLLGAAAMGLSGGAMLARSQGYSWPVSVALGAVLCIVPWYVNWLPERK